MFSIVEMRYISKSKIAEPTVVERKTSPRMVRDISTKFCFY